DHRAASCQRLGVFPSPMSHDHLCLSAGVDDLCGPCASAPPAGPYGRPSHRLRRTPLRWPASLVPFFYNPFTQLILHLLDIRAIHCQCVGHLLIRYLQSHEIKAQDPHLQGLMMARKNGVRQVIKASVTGVTLGALTGWLCVIKATLANLCGLTRGARNA